MTPLHLYYALMELVVSNDVYMLYLDEGQYVALVEHCYLPSLCKFVKVSFSGQSSYIAPREEVIMYACQNGDTHLVDLEKSPPSARRTL